MTTALARLAPLLLNGVDVVAPFARRQCQGAWASTARRMLDIHLDAEGLDHVDPGTSYIVLPLHEGVADVVPILHLPLRLRFVVLAEFLEWPLIGSYLRRTDQIVIPNPASAGDVRRLFSATGDALTNGESVVVFPQGTILGLETAFTRGAFALARRFQVPILPIVLTGSHRVWEHPFSPVVRFGQRISMRVLPPIEPSSDPADLEGRMKRLALEPSMAPARRFVPERDGWWDDYDFEIDPAFTELARAHAEHRAGLPTVR